MKLNSKIEEFRALDINVVGVTYDEVKSNRDFHEDRELKYSLLSDQNAGTVKAFGILNESYSEGDPAYGIPHPGIILVAKDRRVLMTRAEESYRDRPDLDEIINAIKSGMD